MQIPTVEDFINFFGLVETIELSNLENPSNGSIFEERIEGAINTAYRFIMGYDSLCYLSGKIAIRRAIFRLCLDISRYLLDSLQRREDVTTNYENCIRFLEFCVESKDGLIDISDEEALELGLSNSNNVKLSYKSGRRAFTDENLSKFRKQKLYFN